VTLQNYAAFKRLPVSFLEGLGLSDITYLRRPAIRIPFVGLDGTVAAVQIRRALQKTPDSDNRFVWRSGDKPLPYGLRRLAERRPRRLTLVEGASDCHTLWFHEYDALGLPSASTWRSEWNTYLDGIEVIDLVIEPDRGGAAVEAWLATVPFRQRVNLLHLSAEAKDPSALYLLEPATFRARWQDVLDRGESWTLRDQQRRSTAAASNFAAGGALLQSRTLLQDVGNAIAALGYAGDTSPAQLCYVAITSRQLVRPVNLALVALSAAGKSAAVDAAVALHPDEAVFVLRAGSARALVYSDESFEHRTVIVSEADSIPEDGPAASALRSLAADNVMEYDVVEKNPETGRFETRHIRKPGPTGLITTSTKGLRTQMNTRTLEISLADDANQTRAVMKAHANNVNGKKGAPPDLATFHAAQRWLAVAGERRIIIDFADLLADLVPAADVRMRRDFRQLLTVIEALAFLHQLQRPRAPDGSVLATADDYQIARELLAPVFDAITQDKVTPAIRETVEAIAGNEDVSVKMLADRLSIAKSTVTYRVKRALAGGWLVNREERQGHPARLALGAELPEERSALPPANEVFECLKGFREGDRAPSPPRSSPVPTDEAAGSGSLHNLDGKRASQTPPSPQADEVFEV
jgi:hypothetical protein